MKAWMKILMWFGLGGGIGFFAGYQVGQRAQKKEDEEEVSSGYEEENKAAQAFRAYRADGDTYSGDELPFIPARAATDADDEMPEEAPRIGDEEEIEDIPQLHPQDLIPNLISEEEYYTNQWGYDQQSLVWYAGDKILYNLDTRSIVEHPNEVIGLATVMGLDSKHETLFIVNDTISTIFRVDWTDECYDNEVGGGTAEEYAEEDEDFSEEDLD